MVNKAGGKLETYGPLRRWNGDTICIKHLYMTISEANILNNITRVTDNGRFSTHDAEFWRKHGK